MSTQEFLDDLLSKNTCIGCVKAKFPAGDGDYEYLWIEIADSGFIILKAREMIGKLASDTTLANLKR